MTRLYQGILEAYRSIWSETGRSNLPSRTAKAIQRNDDMSEVLVKLIQLVVFAAFGLLYFASPVPNPETTSRFPLIVSLYLIFTLIALVFAVLRAMPSWLVYLSIVIDVALLTYLIFSFHIQYEQPASFSLKAPAMLNYFVLIGLRSLRFEARYVLAAGLASIVGWLALVTYVVVTDPVDPMITRDYVTYLTSNTVLIGAEIAKIISILLFTIILAIAVRRAHSFLVTSVAEGNAAQDLARFMPDAVAEQIREAESEIVPGEGVRRDAAILNVDIRGFTTMVGRMEAQEAMALLSDYQHEIVPIVHKHGGVVDKFMGDGIMITFGASSADPEYCANAMRCADEILSSHNRWSGPAKKVKLNLAVSSGPVIFGAVGEGNRLEYTVIGAPVNDSAKLEKHNKTAGTKGLCDYATYALAVEQGYKRKKRKRLSNVMIEGGQKPRDLVVLG